MGNVHLSNENLVHTIRYSNIAFWISMIMMSYDATFDFIFVGKLNPLEVILVFSIVCIMMISTLWTAYLVNLPIFNIFKILSKICSGLGECQVLCNYLTMYIRYEAKFPYMLLCF